MYRSLVSLAAVFASQSSFGQPSASPVEMFLEMPPLMGESNDRRNKDAIRVLSWSWGVSVPAGPIGGGGGGAGKPSFQDLVFTKWIDSATVPLLAAVAQGIHFPEAILTVRRARGQSVDYLKFELENVLITSVQSGSDSVDDRLTEKVSLNFSRYCLEYQPIENRGAPAGSLTRNCYDIANNTPF